MEEGVRLTWKSIKYVVRSKNKETVVLQNVSGSISPGEMMAIMGSSGAGKSTLLNILAGRISRDESVHLDGQILFNGQPRNRSLRKLVGYVEQDDVMYRSLTVTETLKYAACLRMSNQYSSKGKMERVDQIMSDLRLSKCADTVIGGELARGVSGGERKRIAIGVECIHQPRLLFLDEPTTGLDSFTSFNIIDIIHKLAVSHRITVLMTIHQPRIDILMKFHKLLLLSMGKTIYFGSVPGAFDFFSNAGYPMPEFMNPADHFIDIITIDRRSTESLENSSCRVEKLHDKWLTHRATTADHDADDSIASSEIGEIGDMNRRPWMYDFRVLSSRSILDIRRQSYYSTAIILQYCCLSILLGFTFFRLPLNQDGIQSRLGALFYITVDILYTMIQPIATYIPLERKIIIRERSSSPYHFSAYFFAKSFSQFLVPCVAILVFGLSVYYIIGLNPAADRYFIFQGILICLAFASVSTGFFIGAISPSVQLAQILGPIILVFGFIFAGLLIDTTSIPPELRWLQYVCPTRYAFMALSQNEFSNLNFSCDEIDNTLPNGQCFVGYSTGEEVLDDYGLNRLSIFVCCTVLIGWGLIFQILAFFSLRHTTMRKASIK